MDKVGKNAEKAIEALAWRRVSFDNIPIQYRGDGKMHRPGSKNRKKGFNRRGRRR